VNTVVPIPKGHNANMSDSESYRGIALASIFSKLFDNIVLHMYSNNQVSSELQFGLKTKSSTSMCSMMLKKTMAYYSKNQSSVFVHSSFLSVCLYACYGFLSRGFTDWREILHGGSTTSQTGFLLFWGIDPGMAEFWASTGAIWRDMLLAEALV